MLRRARIARDIQTHSISASCGPWPRVARFLALSVALTVLGGCKKEAELPEDPEFAIPGEEVDQISEAQVAGIIRMDMPEVFEPPLAIPGEENVTPPPLPAMPTGMPPGMQPGQLPPGMQPGQVPPGMQPGQVPTGMQPAAGASVPVQLAPGFTPDPHLTRGPAGGPVDANSFDPGCTGHVTLEPTLSVVVMNDFQLLRILVNSPVDTVLVMQGPDGAYRCNDDFNPSEGLNPGIEGAYGRGLYKIWVGTLLETPGPYVLALSENPALSAQTLQ